jgi:hypothetical protein
MTATDDGNTSKLPATLFAIQKKADTNVSA